MSDISNDEWLTTQLQYSAKWIKICELLEDYPENEPEHLKMDIDGNLMLARAFASKFEAEVTRLHTIITTLKQDCPFVDCVDTTDCGNVAKKIEEQGAQHERHRIIRLLHEMTMEEEEYYAPPDSPNNIRARAFNMAEIRIREGTIDQWEI